MPFWLAVGTSAFCGWLAGWLATWLASRREVSVEAARSSFVSTTPRQISPAWALASGLAAGVLLAELLSAIGVTTSQHWWPTVYASASAGTLASVIVPGILRHRMPTRAHVAWTGILTVLLALVVFLLAISSSSIGSSISIRPEVSLVLVALVACGLILMLAMSESSKPVATPALGASFVYALVMMMSSRNADPMAAAVVAGACLAAAIPHRTVRLQPFPLWAHSAIVFFLAGDAIVQGAWNAFALAAITAVAIVFLMRFIHWMPGTLRTPTKIVWSSAALAFGSAVVLLAASAADSPAAVGFGLAVLLAVTLLVLTARTEMLSGLHAATAAHDNFVVPVAGWSSKELTRGIQHAASCQMLWNLVSRSHESAGLVTVKWQLPGACFETAAQEHNPEHRWQISIPLAPSAWIEAEWDPSLKVSLRDATRYLETIAGAASRLSLDHIEALFDDNAESGPAA